jgi:hypothetical protein
MDNTDQASKKNKQNPAIRAFLFVWAAWSICAQLLGGLKFLYTTHTFQALTTWLVDQTSALRWLGLTILGIFHPLAKLFAAMAALIFSWLPFHLSQTTAERATLFLSMLGFTAGSFRYGTNKKFRPLWRSLCIFLVVAYILFGLDAAYYKTTDWLIAGMTMYVGIFFLLMTAVGYVAQYHKGSRVSFRAKSAVICITLLAAVPAVFYVSYWINTQSPIAGNH